MGQHNIDNELAIGNEFPTVWSGFKKDGLYQMVGWGSTLPTSTDWGKGALFMKTDSGKLYVNGAADGVAADFKLVTSA